MRASSCGLSSAAILRREDGRRFKYDVTGASTRRPTAHGLRRRCTPATWTKAELPPRPEPRRARSDLALSPFPGRDEGSATGGPRPVARSSPPVATIDDTVRAHVRRRQQARSNETVSSEVRPLSMPSTFYRAGDDGPGRLTPARDRPGTQPGGPRIADRESPRGGATPGPLHTSSPRYTRIAFAAVGQNTTSSRC